MLHGGSPADAASAQGRRSRAFAVVGLIVALGAIGSGAVRLGTGRLNRIARGAAPPAQEGDGKPRRRWPSLSAMAVEPDRSPPPDDHPARSETAEPPPGPAAPEPPPAAGKLSDTTPAGLAAARSRVALAELGPREARLADSGLPAGGPEPAWHSSVKTIRQEVALSLIANAGVRVSDQTCFRAGCQFSIDAFDEAANVQARGRLKMLLRGETPNPFPGETFVSGLVTRPDGFLRTTVILYAPAEAALP
jgi:hypothetical protein